jgi:AraC family transcriptional regulator, regulatory protein of adaptative response / DNA-3-methyladenine glycosylase II
MSRWRNVIDYYEVNKTMELDEQVCSRARLARDARFDGKFFIGVLTTRIYCRPICRSRTSKESNVRYFPSAAAAAEAGFRPCLRCRPEQSPGTRAWHGTQNTVTRGLRLISETGLEDGGVEALAEHLGVGPRHLRRLFLRHLGATPSAVAQTRRLQFAKKLIDETNLPMGQIALASGFGSVRRFNGTIRKVYGRTPTQIRSLAPRKSWQPEDQYLFHLDFRPPYDWKRVTEFLAIRAIPGVEVFGAGIYRRSIRVNENRGYFEVSFDTGRNGINVRVQIGDPRSLFFIIERVRAIFDLDADWGTISRTLRTDPVLASRIRCDPGLRVPGCWNAFEFATQAIVEQQIDIRRANTLTGRMVRHFGQTFRPTGGITHLFPTPEVLADADLETIGLPQVKADAIRALARAVRDGHISFEKLADPDALLARLFEIPGIGRGAAQWVAMRALREPDAIPSLDPDLARALRAASASEVEERSKAWRPWRAYAAMYLWISSRNEIQGRATSPSSSPIHVSPTFRSAPHCKSAGLKTGATNAGIPTP